MRFPVRSFLPLIAAFLTLLIAVEARVPAPRDDLSEKDRARVEKVTRPTTDFTAAERFERRQAGAATSTKRVNADAYSHPSANLKFEDEQRFLLGNGLFRKEWVSAPSSTQASDGLGPLFNARACQSCHIKDGRGHAPASRKDAAVSLLVRLSVPPTEKQEEAIRDGRLSVVPEPVYGGQLQDFAVAGLPAEGRVRIDYAEVPVRLGDGEIVRLRRPKLSIDNPGFGPLHPDVMLSARVAPPMIGLGLLEAIDRGDILVREDPQDADGDGISGRARWVRDKAGEWHLGRFGWKGNAMSVEQQTADAFFGDMGLSTPLVPDHWGECTKAEGACRELPHGAQPHLGAEEVPAELLDLVVFYSQNLAVPARRDVDDPSVLAGKQVFYEAGCTNCHTPKFVTRRDAAVPALAFQLIWPYTDLLLHDMGEGLADHRPEGTATGYEWRTPPLWGIGLAKTVHGEATFLHDGRARTLLEAILWHGGEAKAARDRVVEMDKADRDNLIRFLESL
ncbi:di-heme oxidoredictase family protein [Chelativorans sp. M5D2P16]|uniref:di-heme oxidoreductase family protein n=1 Tax=Chelativorans sp. M5D2P16 TaxID=3095678 RepID=UPI002ACAECC3|nr:di-heme oxidoredictase family protein [Chelativorans sp. M5D2P16]MDZ5699799.1 di-heme oxidoredictase family protein [Chelativorans sp. M5D2P16]